MTDRPYTDADVATVVRALPVDHEDGTTLVEVVPGEPPRHIWGRPDRVAHAVLDALAAAGRLNSALDHIAELAIAYVNEPVENTDRISERYYELEAAVRHMQAVDAREAQP